MRASTRLIANTLLTYARMGVSIGLGLLATRLALRALGVDDFGIYAAAFALVTTLYVLSDGMSSAAARVLALEVGRAQPAREATGAGELPDRAGPAPAGLASAFGTLVTVFVVLALVALAGGALGAWLAPGFLRVPGWAEAALAPGADRVGTTRWVVGLLAVMVSCVVVATPWRALFMAHQRFGAVTGVDLLDAALKLGVAAGLTFIEPGPGGAEGGGAEGGWAEGGGADRLVAYAAGLMGTQVLATGLVVALAWRAFPGARPRGLGLHGPLVRETARFAGWSMVGTLSYRVRIAGPPLLLAATFGPVYNAATGLAAQVAGYLLNITAAIVSATQPALVSAHGRGDAGNVRRLVSAANKFCVLVPAVAVAPILIEADYLLGLWLTEPPAEAARFVRLTVGLYAATWIYTGYYLAAVADGRIGAFMTLALGLELAGLGAAWALLAAGGPAWGVLALGAGVSLLATFVFTAHITRLTGLPVRDWFTRAWAPVLVTITPAAGAALAAHAALPPGPLRLAAVTGVFGAVYAPLLWMWGLEPGERALARGLLSRLRPGR